MPNFEDDNNISGLEEVIEDSINDSTSEVVDDSIEASADDTSTDAPVEDNTVEGDHPVAPGVRPDPAQRAEDDFAKKFGLQSQSVTGRENRIPYSRVKKIVAKAEQDAVARITKEVEGKFAPQVQEFQTRVQDYETRLQKVAQFEHILENDPRTFLNMLSEVPAYKQFFQYVAQAISSQQAPASEAQPYLDHSDMPQPDVNLPDGSRVYSLDGLAKRDEWLARKIEEKAVRQAENRLSQRYAPIEQEWQAQQQYAKMVPVVERQIAEARTWDRFNELEPKVVQLLRSDKNLTLERAYLKAYQEDVVPRLAADKNKMRTELLEEIKKKPVASSAPTGPTKPRLVSSQTGPRNIEDVIAASLEEAGLK